MFVTAFEKRSTITTGQMDQWDDFWYNIGGAQSSSGIAVGRDTAMRLWSVFSCVSLISSYVALIPLKTKRKFKDGTIEDATDLPIYNILKLNPNPNMTSFNWREAKQANILSSGNGYSWIERSRKGIKGLWHIEPKYVKARFANRAELKGLKITKGSLVVYDVNFGDGKVWTIYQQDMFHVPAFSFNGLVGESVITNFAKNTIGTGLQLDNFQGNWFKKGIQSSGTFEHPSTLGENKDKFIKALKERFQGSTNSGVPMVLEGGMKWEPGKISMVDQQFLEQINASATQIAAMFHVPPSKIGIFGKGTSYNNTEYQAKQFVDDTLMQWLIRFEQAATVKLLTPQEREDGYYIKFNVDALLRPESKTRKEIDQIDWMMGVPLNDIRKRNDENPVEGGDTSYIPLNMVDSNAPKDVPDDQNQRTYLGADKVTTVFEPLLRKTVEGLIRREAKAIQREITKIKKGKNDRMFGEWVDEFYSTMPEFIAGELLPVFRSFQKQLFSVFKPGKEITLDITARDFSLHFGSTWTERSKTEILNSSEDLDNVVFITNEWLQLRTTETINELRNTSRQWAAKISGLEN